jgi:hypothetical protein
VAAGLAPIKRRAAGGLKAPAHSRFASNSGPVRCGVGRVVCAMSRRERMQQMPPLLDSSAVASNVGGMVRPSVLAVLKLITSSNLLDWTTGRSVGFAPLSMCFPGDLVDNPPTTE